MRRGAFLFIIIFTLLLLFSCDVEILTGEENVNDYIYPYVDFTLSEDGSYYTATVVDGAQMEEVYIPSLVDNEGEAVPVKYFDGFENPEDAQYVSVIVLESDTTQMTDNATSSTSALVNVSIKEHASNAAWGYLPPVEKEEKEFIGWFIEGTSTQVFEGDPITNPIIEPRFKDHTLTQHAGKPATCMSSGWADYVTCSTCFYTTYKELPKLNHSLTHHSAVSATCTSDGVREYWSCSNCNSMFSDEAGISKIDVVVLAALGHTTFHVEEVEAECGKEGKREHWECERCHSLFGDAEAVSLVTEAELVIPALEHNFVRSQFSAESTCTWDECTRCHETTNPTGHSWDDGVVVVDATETSKGTMRYTCTNCRITMEEDIAPLDVTHVHSWEDGQPVEKTCTSRGYTVRECSQCHVSYHYKYDDAEGHKTVVFEANEPTCTADGNSKYYQCSVCSGLFKDRNAINGTTSAEVTEEKLGHNWTEGYETSSTGHWHTCRRCNATSEVVSHTYNCQDLASSHLKSSATCTAAAVYYYSCVCGKNGEVTFTSGMALEHVLTHTAGEPATCLHEGYHEYWTCSRCEKSFYDSACINEITEANKNVISKKAHTDSGTYVSVGQSGHKKYCSACEQGYGDVIAHNIQSFEWGGSDSTHHWHICRYCSFQADRAAHTYVAYGTDEVCSVCLHTKEKEQTTSGGFNIQATTLEPKGTLTVTRSGSGYHAVFTLAAGSNKTSIEWFLDDEKLTSVTDECDFTTPLSRTYTITCVLYNNQLGNSYSQKVYGGDTP